eukprot:Mycagemm_TRINITY_DN10252_c0_g2::TRINITY_DN10252_c0_g2_i1::g.4069::m.4069 type:complete len:126 gc:universal TRINITY_DN10252_c0_g2_i1:1170-793(-)
MPASCRCTMWLRLSCESGWKMTMSSRRLRNSGRKWAFTTVMTLSTTSCGSLPLSALSSTTLASFFACKYLSRCSAPRLLVMMITTLLKSTVLPCPSVRRPSSNTCSKTFQTCGWAFSTSSKRRTA